MRAKEKMSAVDSLRLFDSCVTLGRIVHSEYPECLETADDLLKLMDRYHIAEALVHEYHARVVYPREHGNSRLLEAIKGFDRLHPAWVIEPPKTPGKDAANAMVDKMLEAGVKVARFPMKRVPPMAWLWNDLCSVLEEHSVPCFLDFGEVSTVGELSDTDVNGVRDIALACPELPMVLSHVMGGFGIHPAVMHLMHRLHNLYIDNTGILEFWREAAREVGPERVLFATSAPFTDPGHFVPNIQYAIGFDEKAKKLMSGDNLRRLIRRVK